MTTVLILAVLVLVAIAIWQMTKIFELSQLKAETSQIANDSDNKTNGYLLFAFLIFIYGITIFSFWKYSKFLLPEAASEHGNGYDNLMLVSFVIIFIVQRLRKLCYITSVISIEERKVKRLFSMLIMTAWSLFGRLFR